MEANIVIPRRTFLDMLHAKEEFDSIIESIELKNNPEVMKSISKSREDIRGGRVHRLRDILEDYNV